MVELYRYQKILGLPEKVVAQWYWVCSSHRKDYDSSPFWIYDPIDENELKNYLMKNAYISGSPACHECARVTNTQRALVI